MAYSHHCDVNYRECHRPVIEIRLREKDLADALDAILANKQPRVAATEAPGCTLDSPDQSSERDVLTYHNRISRIVQTNCVECHRDGGVAPERFMIAPCWRMIFR